MGQSLVLSVAAGILLFGTIFCHSINPGENKAITGQSIITNCCDLMTCSDCCSVDAAAFAPSYVKELLSCPKGRGHVKGQQPQASRQLCFLGCVCLQGVSSSTSHPGPFNIGLAHQIPIHRTFQLLNRSINWFINRFSSVALSRQRHGICSQNVIQNWYQHQLHNKGNYFRGCRHQWKMGWFMWT